MESRLADRALTGVDLSEPISPLATARPLVVAAWRRRARSSENWPERYRDCGGGSRPNGVRVKPNFHHCPSPSLPERRSKLSLPTWAFLASIIIHGSLGVIP